MSDSIEIRQLPSIEAPKGYRVYRLKGVDQLIVARKGGPSAHDVKNNESYKELRNNQKEFGIASALSKTLRDTLPQELADISEKYASGKLTAQFRNLAKMEEGQTGTRSFVLSEHGKMLQGFNFNSEHPFPEEFSSKFFIKQGSHRGHAILHFPEFIPAKTLNAPEETTNFKISGHIVALSDYYYDEAIGAYFPSNPDIHGKWGSFDSQMLPLLKIPMQPFTEQVTANQWKPVPLKAGVFLLLSVRFFKYENSQFRQLSKSSYMQIMKVF